MKKELFNKGWKFWEDKDSFALVWSVPQSAKLVNLPHDAMLLNKANENSKNGANTGFRDGGVYQYSKTITTSTEDAEKTIALHFDGVYMNAQVYVNGQQVCSCPYGYTGFTCILNDYLDWGKENEIRVIARNTNSPNSRWYTGSGIYRDVYMLTAGDVYVEDGSCYVDTESICEEYATLNVNTNIVNRSSKRRNLELKTEIIDTEGNTITDSRKIVVFSGENARYSFRMTVPSPKLWSDETTNLYSIRTSILDDGKLVDSEEHTFGIRKLELDAKQGLRVNGKVVNLRGACIHHDNGLLGAECTYAAEYRRIKLLKEAGFNAIRMAHNPAAQALLKACDELGVYVMDETFDMWTRNKADSDYGLFFNKCWQDDVAAMVKKDLQHPSVIMYSVGNEIPEIGSDIGARIAKEISDFIKTMDKTRFTLASINGVFAAGNAINDIMKDISGGSFKEGNVNDFMMMMDTKMPEIVNHPLVSQGIEKACATLDIAGYNYMTSRYENDYKNLPNRVIVGSETYPPQIAENWSLISKLPNVIGDFTWSGWDYIGEAGVGVVGYAWGEGGFGAGYPYQLAYVGDIDITGFRRPASYYREIVFGLRKEPYIVTQNPYKYGKKPIMTPWVISDSIASWTYPDMDGQPIVIEVYSPGDEAEVIVNGKSLGKKKIEGFIARFDTVYAPGEVECISYENGKKIASYTLKTAIDARLKAEVTYDNEKLVFIDITNADTNGNVDTHTLAHIKVSVDGADFRLGTGNPKSDYNYITDETDSFLGRALLIVKKENSSDKAKVSISLNEQEIKLTV